MHLSEINIYPIKSLKGISVNSAKIEDRGLEHDRRWMLVDEKNRFLTQREHPRMATIGISILDDGLQVRLGPNAPFVIGMEPAGEAENVRIWSSSVKALAYPQRENELFSEYLGLNCRLVRMPDSSRRKVNPYYAVRRFEDVVSFADGYPFLLTSESSLADLNSRMDEPLPMNRFRPNLVVSGPSPFAEDKWKKIRIGEAIFHVVKPCGRCVITTVDQETGDKVGPEPLTTLASFRKKRGKVLFGQNLIAEEPGAVLSVGDEIEVI